MRAYEVYYTCGSNSWFDGNTCTTDSGFQKYFEATWIIGLSFGGILLVAATVLFLVFRDSEYDTPEETRKNAKIYLKVLLALLFMIFCGPLFFPVALLVGIGFVLRYVLRDLRAGHADR